MVKNFESAVRCREYGFKPWNVDEWNMSQFRTSHSCSAPELEPTAKMSFVEAMQPM